MNYGLSVLVACLLFDFSTVASFVLPAGTPDNRLIYIAHVSGDMRRPHTISTPPLRLPIGKHEHMYTNVRPGTVAGSASTCLCLSGQEFIEAGVSFDTFAPQFMWLLMIGMPRSDLTKKVMGGIVPIIGLAMVHLCIVVLAAAQEGALSQVLIFQEVFDPSMSQLGGMQKLFAFPNFVAEEWPHVLIWDLFVGRAIWLDGLEKGISTRLALTFCNFIGPPGFLIHVATCLIKGKGLTAMGYDERNES